MCFSLGWLENLLIGLVIVAMVVAILKLLIPWVLSWFDIGISAVVMRVLNILVAGVILIWLIIIVFDLLACVLPIGRVR